MIKPDINLNLLAYDIHSANAWKGFWPLDKEPNLAEKIMLVVTELSEAVEELRAGSPRFYLGDGGKPEGVDVELVDALIRLLDILGYREADIDTLLQMKLAYNESRPHKHGKAF